MAEAQEVRRADRWDRRSRGQPCSRARKTPIVALRRQRVTGTKLILEINPDHPVVKRLKAETDEPHFVDRSHIVFDQALRAKGGELDDTASFVNTTQRTDADGGRATQPSNLWLP
jgi:HSP90 family molecular chaperone